MILLKDLRKEFNGQPALKCVNLEVEKGETMVIMGRSGCGKSVLLKLIIGLLEPDGGRIWIDGKETTDLTEKQMDEVRKKFGMVFQSSALFDSLTVGENVGFSLSRHKDMSREQIAQVVAEKLELVGLRGIEDSMPADLSGGMKKRVSLARAISMDPEIILYDEPTTGLDPVMAGEINLLIARLHDRLAMMYDGEITAVGTPEEFRQSTEPVVRRFLDA
jgi:phospholipid/cholesterol/gamma-HCH transport system ATP-binding protein